MYAVIRKMGDQKATTGTIELKKILPGICYVGVGRRDQEVGIAVTGEPPCLQDLACKQKAQDSRKKASSSFLPSITQVNLILRESGKCILAF